MKNKVTIEFKTNQLKEFGLNPNHWIISGKTGRYASLIHIDDPDLELEVAYELKNQTAQIIEIKYVI